MVPDVGSLNLPGAKAEKGSGKGKQEYGGTDGVSGLKALGVRDLTYRLFLMMLFMNLGRLPGEDVLRRGSVFV